MLIICKNCQIEVEQKHKQKKGLINTFCSRSCAAKYNNKVYPKRHPLNRCQGCSKGIHKRSKYCQACYYQNKNFHAFDLNQTISNLVYTNHHKSSTFALIRSQCRTFAKSLGWNECIKCGYNQHIEFAHIKPISKFDMSAKIYEVNNIYNILPLCPNCHWEFDHDKWNINEIQDKVNDLIKNSHKLHKWGENPFTKL